MTKLVIKTKGNRLKYIREAIYKENAKTFGKRFGFTGQYIQFMEKKDYVPAKALEQFKKSEINTNWILTGEGKPVIAGDQHEIN